MRQTEYDAMADIIDLAQTQHEFLHDVEISARKPTEPDATGFCLNCGEPLPAGHRWCNVDCRDDWERRTTHG
jgi:hypothetical protein